MNCSLKYTLSTRLPLPAIVPLRIFSAFSSNTYPAPFGSLSSAVTAASASVVPLRFTLDVAVSGYAPFSS